MSQHFRSWTYFTLETVFGMMRSTRAFMLTISWAVVGTLLASVTVDHLGFVSLGPGFIVGFLGASILSWLSQKI